MVTRKTWEEFRECGLLWWINMILHTFGWAICLGVDEDGKVQYVFPARVKYRGFEADINDKGYRRVSGYLKNNAEELYEESLK